MCVWVFLFVDWWWWLLCVVCGFFFFFPARRLMQHRDWMQRFLWFRSQMWPRENRNVVWRNSHGNLRRKPQKTFYWKRAQISIYQFCEIPLQQLVDGFLWDMSNSVTGLTWILQMLSTLLVFALTGGKEWSCHCHLLTVTLRKQFLSLSP